MADYSDADPPRFGDRDETATDTVVPATGEVAEPGNDAGGKPATDPRPSVDDAAAVANTAVAALSRADLLELLGALEARLLDAFTTKLAFDAFKERQIDRLHDELQGHRADLVMKAARPMLQSLIQLHDGFGKVLGALDREDRALLTPERLIGLMREFREDVALTLEQNGVTRFIGEGETFDPRRQRVMRRMVTSEPDQVGRVAARLLPGFEQNGGILEKERVAVYVTSTPNTQEQ